MTYQEISHEQGAANKIRGHMLTLELYRSTSMRLHNRLVQSVYDLAAQQRTEVDAILNEYPDSRMVERWYRKFDEYITQYQLV